eukprot:2123254-Prymnesium_polylepis.2
MLVSHFPSATEVENTYQVAHLLDAEFLLIEALRFDLVVYQPYLPLTEYLQHALLVEIVGTDAIESFRQTAWFLLNDCFRAQGPARKARALACAPARSPVRMRSVATAPCARAACQSYPQCSRQPSLSTLRRHRPRAVPSAAHDRTRVHSHGGAAARLQHHPVARPRRPQRAGGGGGDGAADVHVRVLQQLARPPADGGA